MSWRPRFSTTHIRCLSVVHQTPCRARALHAAATSSTVNASEIAHFSRLAELWWDERGEFGLLHKMNPHRVRFVRDKVLEAGRVEHGEDWACERDAHALRGLDVLDVGCGGGILSEVRRTLCSRFSETSSHILSCQTLARLGARTLAIDASEKNVAIAALHAAADPAFAVAADGVCGSLTYRHAAAETLVQEQQRFDVVCSMEVVEHVDNPASFLRALAELVKVRHSASAVPHRR
jgi:polyprenyldihydroxybenzoate methyltransferase/3-demethylubiquinol 3-O-methyltransferase